ncbi:cytochrome c [Bradyrhizobium sp.]|uniref:c-type cytochrome n=1 Tax=Bradyrhizobium sp. TaxID=376 RepID=UPI002D3EFB68|nr:cytochrome c [Bradyrhizobium sp.]HZR73475.1 cytochrome c [Bradyrhizobium sp.]
MWRRLTTICVAFGAFFSTFALAAEQYNLGRPVLSQELAGWNIDVRPDGAGLPYGKGSAKSGREIFANSCAMCHGEKGEGKPMDRLVGGFGTLATKAPIKTVGSYWPYTSTLFDYIRRAMPFNAPQSLSNDDVYAVVAYILFLNNIVPEDAVLDERTLPKIIMPNRNGFTSVDPRPDIKSEPCMTDCR